MGKFFFNLNAKKRLSNCDSKFRGNKTKYRQILLHFTDSVFFLFVCFLFYKLKVCDNSTWSYSISAIFATASAHFMSLCHILVSYHISNFSLPVMVIWGRWPSTSLWLLSGTVNYAHIGWWTQLTQALHVLCSQSPTDQGFPSLTLLRFLCSLRHNNIEIRPINNPKRTSKCSSERKSLSTHQA